MATFLFYQDTSPDMGRAHDVLEQGESQMLENSTPPDDYLHRAPHHRWGMFS
jgi:hypothetical protein